MGFRGSNKRLELALAGIFIAAIPLYAQQTTPAPGPEGTQGPAAQTAPAETTPLPPPNSTTPPSKPGSGASPTSEAENPQPPAPKPQPGPTVGPDGVVQGVHPGSIEDVNAVGTRDIGGRGLGNWYSTESEIKEGKAYSMEIEKSVRFVNDPVVTEFVNRIGQNLVKNSDAKVPFTIKVIDDDSINAMALPGGFFYVNSGAILAADEEAELAGVMAHEIAHVAAHHAMREQTRMNYAQLSTIPLIMIGGYAGYGLYEAAQIGVPLTFLQFSRDFEDRPITLACSICIALATIRKRLWPSSKKCRAWRSTSRVRLRRRSIRIHRPRTGLKRPRRRLRRYSRPGTSTW